MRRAETPVTGSYQASSPRHVRAVGKVPESSMHLEFRYDYLGRRVDGARRRGEGEAAGFVPALAGIEKAGALRAKTRQKKVWNNTAGSGAPATHLKFLYEGMQLITELNSDGTLSKSFHWGADRSDTIGGAGGAEGLVHVHDWVANKSYYPSYDPNGNVVQQGGSFATGNPIGFSTQYTDRETGLVYYGFRYYLPKLGRFLTRDPIGEAGGANLYRFAGNNPVMNVDVWGLCVEPPEPQLDYEGARLDDAYGRDVGIDEWAEFQEDYDAYLECLELSNLLAFDALESEGLDRVAREDLGQSIDTNLASYGVGVGYYVSEEISGYELDAIDLIAIRAINSVFQGRANASHLRINGRQVNGEMLQLATSIHEFGGAIFEYEGQLYLSRFVMGNGSTVDPENILSFENFLDSENGLLKRGSYSVVALWHTHTRRGPSSGPAPGGLPWVGDVGTAWRTGLRVYTGRGIDFVDRVNPFDDNIVANVANEGRRWYEDLFHKPWF